MVTPELPVQAHQDLILWLRADRGVVTEWDPGVGESGGYRVLHWRDQAGSGMPHDCWPLDRVQAIDWPDPALSGKIVRERCPCRWPDPCAESTLSCDPLLCMAQSPLYVKRTSHSAERDFKRARMAWCVCRSP